MAETKEQLIIRFRGICGHIDLSNGNGSKKEKRTVLIRHQNGNGNIEHHVPYIEFFKDDVTSAPGLTLVEYSRPGVQGRLARVDLEEGTEIRLKNKPPGKVEEELGYQRDVPHMSEVLPKAVVAPSLKTKDAKDVDRTRVTAVFDMPAGRLFAGEPEALKTTFGANVPTFTPRRLARWSDLYTEYVPPLVVQLVPLGGGAAREITFDKSLRMITIGNEPERLIYGIVGASQADVNGHNDHRGQSAQPTGHYSLYYNLLASPPADPPLPEPAQIDGSGCPNNNYP